MPVMKDGYFYDDYDRKHVQEMWTLNSDNIKKPKGLRQVLEERGFDTGEGKEKLVKEELIEIMENEPDFVEDKKIFKALQASKKVNKYSKVILFPKYHCEFNMMENVWMDTKNEYDRTRDFKGKKHAQIKDRINQIMDGIPLSRARKYIMNSMAYCHGYEGGAVGQAVLDKINDYKKARLSHRRAHSNLIID